MIQKHLSWSEVSGSWSWKWNRRNIRERYEALAARSPWISSNGYAADSHMALQSPKHTTWESRRARLFKDLKSNTYVAIAAVPYIPQQFPVRHSKAESVFIAWQQCSVKLAFLLHLQQGIGFTILQHPRKIMSEKLKVISVMLKNREDDRYLGVTISGSLH